MIQRVRILIRCTISYRLPSAAGTYPTLCALVPGILDATCVRCVGPSGSGLVWQHLQLSSWHRSHLESEGRLAGVCHLVFSRAGNLGKPHVELMSWAVAAALVGNANFQTYLGLDVGSLGSSCAMCLANTATLDLVTKESESATACEVVRHGASQR